METVEITEDGTTSLIVACKRTEVGVLCDFIEVVLASDPEAAEVADANIPASAIAAD